MRLQGSRSAAQVAGPGLGGLLVQVVGAANALLADAASFLVSTVCLLGISGREPPRPARQHRPLWTDVGDGFRFLAADPYLRPLVLFGAVNNLSMVGLQSLNVLFLVRVVGVGPAPSVGCSQR